MNPPMKKKWSIYQQRFDRFMSGEFYAELSLPSQKVRKVITEGIELAMWSPTDDDRPKIDVAMAQEYKSVGVGVTFGPSWTTHWFRLKLPKVEMVEGLMFHWFCHAEGLIWNAQGEPLHGLSSQDRSDVPYSLISENGDSVTIYIEMACNSINGNGETITVGKPASNRMYQLERCEFRYYNVKAVNLYTSLQILQDLINVYGEGRSHGKRALFVANKIINTFLPNSEEALDKCQLIVDEFFNSAPNGTPLKVMAVGNCHIDTAWLWRYYETHRKTARSWSSQLAIMKYFPDYIFAASQMQQLSWLRDDYPSLFERIQQAVSDKRFLPIGGSWVEMDGNLPSGESFARQFLYGQEFQKKYFGEYSQTFWLPDTFGYNAQLPQLMTLAGMKYFITQKITWNNVNNFPNTSFWWEGLEGTRVLTHFPPADTYTSQANAGDVIKSESNNKDVDRSNHSLLLYGFGDGGGGPTYEMVSRLQKMKNIIGVPSVSFASPDDFFNCLSKEAHEFVTWKGEIYLELHRGTYTSHAKTKLYNRKCEIWLREAEMLAWLLGLVSNDYDKYYPKEQLECLWKDVLLNQFHDVLPGSSIGEVYNDSTKIYENVKYQAVKIRDVSMNELFGNSARVIEKKPLKEIVFFNTTPYTRNETIVVPFDGDHDSVQNGVIAVKGIKGFSMESLADSRVAVTKESSNAAKLTFNQGTGYTMENDVVLINLDNCGNIIKFFDKEFDRDIVPEGSMANTFMMYEDAPFFWDAWDVEMYHVEKGRCVSNNPDKIKLSIGMEGPLMVSILRIIEVSPQSCIHQVITLNCFSKRLDFSCRIEWNESHQILKALFPVNVHSDCATYECPFGMVTRPTHENTSWDYARFEVCGHRFADLSESDYGVALLNDCKYGYAVSKNVMALSLLRAPKMPDPDCDMGSHVMKFALYPHRGDVSSGGVVEEATIFNTELLWTAASPSTYDKNWLGHPVLQFTTLSSKYQYVPLAIDSVKLAEDGTNDVIIRAYEPRGSRGEAVLVSHPMISVTNLTCCDILEREIEGQKAMQLGNGNWKVSYSPFKILTLRARIALKDADKSRTVFSIKNTDEGRASCSSFEDVN